MFKRAIEMNEDKLHEIELKTLTNTLHIGQIKDSIDSHFENTKLQHQKIFDKLDQMPDEDRIMRLFAEQGEKLARGLIKRDDEQQSDIDGIKNEISGAKKGLKWAYTVIAGIGGLLGINALK